MNYTYKSTQSMNLRPTPSVENSSIGTLPANTMGSGNELFFAPSDVIKNGITLQKAGDGWLKVETGGSVIGWVAVIHLGKVYGALTDLVTTPPPVATAYPVAISLTPLDANGNPIGEPKIYRA